MNIKTKFELGDLVTDEHHLYTGMITHIEGGVSFKDDGTSKVSTTTVIYTITSNGRTSRINECSLYKLQLAKEK